MVGCCRGWRKTLLSPRAHSELLPMGREGRGGRAKGGLIIEKFEDFTQRVRVGVFGGVHSFLVTCVFILLQNSFRKTLTRGGLGCNTHAPTHIHSGVSSSLLHRARELCLRILSLLCSHRTELLIEKCFCSKQLFFFLPVCCWTAAPKFLPCLFQYFDTILQRLTAYKYSMCFWKSIFVVDWILECKRVCLFHRL